MAKGQTTQLSLVLILVVILQTSLALEGERVMRAVQAENITEVLL